MMLTVQAAILALLLGAGSLAAQTEGSPELRDLTPLAKQFSATEPPIVFEYAVAYRFLHVELSRLGNLVMTTTVGNWRPAGSLNSTPAVFVDLQFDSRDARGAARRARVSVHDRIVAAIAVPGLEALVFAKDTDEYLNPLIGRSRVLRSVSCYDVQSGALDFRNHDLLTGIVATNVSDPAAIVELSRKVRPILEFLAEQSAGEGTETVAPEALTIDVNASGKVVPLRLRTVRERSPPCLGGTRVNALRIDAVPASKTDERIYRFRAWTVPFHELAERLADPALQQASREAFVKAVVPVGAEYELALGSIRMTLVAAHGARP